MTKYRVFGEKIQSFYTDVDAANPNSAYDIANNKPMHNWFEIQNDDIIEVTDVYLNDQSNEVQLNKDMNDDLPDMTNGIVISDKSDI